MNNWNHNKKEMGVAKWFTLSNRKDEQQQNQHQTQFRHFFNFFFSSLDQSQVINNLRVVDTENTFISSIFEKTKYISCKTDQRNQSIYKGDKAKAKSSFMNSNKNK